MRNFDAKLAIALTLALVFALRAVTPAGYMPGAPGSGLLFELCPDQLPAGVSLPGADTSAHHHHHGGETDTANAPADHCQIGHLLISLITSDAEPILDIAPPPLAIYVTREGQSWPSHARTVFQIRGPPVARQL